MELRYIVLGDNKTPTEKLTNGGRPLEEVEHFRNLGLLIPYPYVVLDVDTREEGEIIHRIVEGEGIKCGIMQTPHGYHFWFKTAKEIKNTTKERLAIGIRGDFRSWGVKDGRPKLSYVRIKREGEWCEWLQEPADVDPFPFWLRPVNGKDMFKDMGEGDGRNQALFNYILQLQSKRFTTEEIRTILRIINTYVFIDPLPERELDLICRDEAFKDESSIEEERFARDFLTDKGEFKHDVFARALVEGMRVITVNEISYVYRNGFYQEVDREIERRMIEEYPIIRKAQRAEVLDYMKIITAKRADEIPIEEYILTLKNTRLDVRTGKTLPFDPEVIDFTQLPVEYDPEAQCPILDKMLVKVFRGDREVIMLFEEMVGYLLIKSCRYRKGFLFYGSGSNGKSTILNMLKAFLGETNCSTIEMGKLGENFLTADLHNKLANIGDDISRNDINDTGTIKKLFTGESLTVRHIYGKPFTMRSYAKLIFSCNDLPHIADRSAGMYSRLMLIPFNAVFSPHDADFDPYIEEKITSPEALSHLLNLGLKGLKRLISRNRFTEPKAVLDTVESYKIENSTTLSWMEDEGLEVEDLLIDTTDKLYSKFADWCMRSGVRMVPTIRTFHKDIESHFGLERKRSRNAKTGGTLRSIFTVKDDS